MVAKPSTNGAMHAYAIAMTSRFVNFGYLVEKDAN